MAAEGGNNIVRFTYTGAAGEHIPDGATHIIVAESCTFVRADAFQFHENIVEVICHDGVEKIERGAFYCCRSLRRVIIPGVTILEQEAFGDCEALNDVECGKLEIIEDWAFNECTSLRNIDLPSARIVEERAFHECDALTRVKFGSKLERIEGMTFMNCVSLERITIPLKYGLITADDTFQGCKKLIHVDLIEGELHETIAALHLEEWRNEMNEEIDTINRILSAVDAGGWDDDDDPVYGIPGEKAMTIGGWIIAVLRKMNHYKTEHQRMLGEAGSSLRHVLPHDIVMNNVLSFLELPPHTFEVSRGSW